VVGVNSLELRVAVCSFPIDGLHIINGKKDGVSNKRLRSVYHGDSVNSLGLSLEGLHYSLEVKRRLGYASSSFRESSFNYIDKCCTLRENRFFQHQILNQFDLGECILVHCQHALQCLE